MHEFKVKYKNGGTQMVTAKRHHIEGGWIKFLGEGNEVVLSVAASEVRSVARADVPDAKGPNVFVA